jgi:hypothetical protein
MILVLDLVLVMLNKVMLNMVLLKLSGQQVHMKTVIFSSIVPATIYTFIKIKPPKCPPEMIKFLALILHLILSLKLLVKTDKEQTFHK